MEAIQFAYQGFAKQNYTMLDNLKLGYGGTKSEMERLLADATKLLALNTISTIYLTYMRLSTPSKQKSELRALQHWKRQRRFLVLCCCDEGGSAERLGSHRVRVKISVLRWKDLLKPFYFFSF